MYTSFKPSEGQGFQPQSFRHDFLTISSLIAIKIQKKGKKYAWIHFFLIRDIPPITQFYTLSRKKVESTFWSYHQLLDMIEFQYWSCMQSYAKSAIFLHHVNCVYNQPVSTLNYLAVPSYGDFLFKELSGGLWFCLLWWFSLLPKFSM